MNPKKQLRTENAIIRNLDGLTMETMKLAAGMHRRGESPNFAQPVTNDHDRKIRRAWTVLAAINKLPGREFFGISVSNPQIFPQVPRA